MTVLSRASPTPSGSADAHAVEASMRRGIEIAREQRAKSLELRVALSLARRWRAQGRIPEARDLLAGAYGWFTEGFETPDLMAARALLDELT
jgi:predicted ATPase